MAIFRDATAQMFKEVLGEKAVEVLAEEIGEVIASDKFETIVRSRARREARAWLRAELGLTPPRYVDEYAFVEEYLAVMFPQTPETAWSPRWFEHPSVKRRMEVMWRSFEAYVAVNPETGEEEWLRHVGSYHMRWITDRHNGPFCRSRHGHNQVLASLEVADYEEDDTDEHA